MDHVTVTRDDDIAEIRMRNPRRRNSLSLAMMRELQQALHEVADSDATGVIVTGEGPAWSSGHDFADMVDRGLADMRELLATCTELMLLVQAVPQPVLASVHGPAWAAGCQLVATCDLAVAAEEATFAAPGGRGGWFCHTPMVAIGRAVPRKQALELALTGEPVDAATAERWGLVNRVVPADRLRAASLELLRRASRGSRLSKALGKQTFYNQIDLDLPKAYAFATEVMAASSQTDDAREGMRAFVDKREPKFVEEASWSRY